jgi:signal peptidase
MEIAPIPRRRAFSARAVILIAVAVLVPVSLLAAVPTMLGLQRYVVPDDSMSGSIGRGSVVFERLVPVSDLEVGDVITYPRPGGHGEEGQVTHRIISLGHGSVRTQGDANPEADPWLVPTPGPTQERVVFHVPYLGYPFIASLGRTFWTLTLLAPLLLLLIAGAVESTRRRKRPARSTVALSRVHRT